MRLEKNFKKLDFEELHMIKDTLNKEIKKRELSSPEGEPFSSKQLHKSFILVYNGTINIEKQLNYKGDL